MPFAPAFAPVSSDPASQQVAQSQAAGVLDVALAQSTTTPGRLTFVWSGGDLVFDRTGAYAVLCAICAKKGKYRWDRTYGTLLWTVRQDRRSTGSQLSQYARDGGVQCEVDQISAAGSTQVRATRIRSGAWSLRVSWTAAGQQRQQEITY